MRNQFRYPWSELPDSELKALCQGELGDAVETCWLGVVQRLAQDGVVVQEGNMKAGKSLLIAVGAWVRSKRQLIKVSEAAQKLLLQVSLDRVKTGNSIARWSDIPNPGSPWHGNGMILVWEPGDQISFVQPCGVETAESFNYLHWVREDDGWGTNVRFPFVLEKGCIADLLQGDLIGEDGEERSEQLSRVCTKTKSIPIALMTVNLLAALNSSYEVCIRRNKRDRRRKRRLGNVRGVQPIELDMTGLATWCRRYETLENTSTEPREKTQDGRRSVEGERRSPVLHPVREHTAIRWVRQPREGEQVFGEKNGTGRTKLYAVKRLRRSCVRGKSLRPDVKRMRVGVDDINTDAGA